MKPIDRLQLALDVTGTPDQIIEHAVARIDADTEALAKISTEAQNAVEYAVLLEAALKDIITLRDKPGYTSVNRRADDMAAKARAALAANPHILQPAKVEDTASCPSDRGASADIEVDFVTEMLETTVYRCRRCDCSFTYDPATHRCSTVPSQYDVLAALVAHLQMLHDAGSCEWCAHSTRDLLDRGAAAMAATKPLEIGTVK